MDILIPDIGDAEDVVVVEICVAVGDDIGADDAVVVIESDKASMEVPAGFAGRVASIEVALGDEVRQGQLIVRLEEADAQVTKGAAAPPADAPDEAETVAEAAPAEPSPEANADPETTVRVEMPDVGEATDVVVIEISAKKGDRVTSDDVLLVVESDKASMEIPAGMAGVVQEIHVAEGDPVVEGSLLATLFVQGAIPETAKTRPPVQETSSDDASETEDAPETNDGSETTDETDKKVAPEPGSPKRAAHLTNDKGGVDSDESGAPADRVYAGPAVRRLGRELGVDLKQVRGSGARGRIVKDDVKAFVKTQLTKPDRGGGGGIPEVPAIDFKRFGEIELQPMTRIQSSGATNLHRSWLNVVHVTQHDDADVTEMEAFRATLKGEAEAAGVKVTPLAFIIKACCQVLKAMPTFNASLDAQGRNFILKKYYHIGFAVDTDQGLVVPVIRNADQLGIFDLSRQIADLAEKARTRKLGLDDVQGASFTISSLGNLGGTGFTPIVNAPEVAILGVSRLAIQPVWNGETFEPRKLLPLSLSYDHRAINGAEGGRFMVMLCDLLKDLRRLTL
ncbi:MAG: dihydrolipoyllysine-residue acetyltransferase [Proteobacteria bacterium]|nr:dihydrolipoyllysine-residue acetyltransferase [Pseudomonadota bacterium]